MNKQIMTILSFCIACYLLAGVVWAENALVFRGKVIQVEVQEFPVHKDLKWVDITSVTPKPKTGWSFDGVNFVAPQKPTAGEILAQKDARKESRLNSPTIKALLKVLAARFSIEVAVLRQQVKDDME